MKLVLAAMTLTLVFLGCSPDNHEPPQLPGTTAALQLCTAAWYDSVNAAVQTGDGQGHGPDVGSDEWKSVIEFRLGVRGDPDVPERDTPAWCQYIQTLVEPPSAFIANASVASSSHASATGPSFACSEVTPGTIEALICTDTELSVQDRQLASVFAAAIAQTPVDETAMLRAEQRGWIKGRDACWQDTDRRSCVESEYSRRIAELQATYQLVNKIGPLSMTCNTRPASELVVTFFASETPTMIAEYNDSHSLMYLQPSASGTRYQGRNESYWEHQGVATVAWGYGTVEMQCSQE
ncbi:MAG: MliC family protein [Pseudohongiella nitratireducens]|nr:MliC family protein [Pseudohongiella nitratireducens]